MTKENAIIALDNIAKGFQDLNEIISSDSLSDNDLSNFMNVVPDYPFAKSFDEIEVQTWVNKAKAYINSLREPIIPQNQENKMSRGEKFEGFLESLKGHGQDVLVESIKKGFEVYYESYIEDEENLHYEKDPKEMVGIKYADEMEVKLPGSEMHDDLEGNVPLPDVEETENEVYLGEDKPETEDMTTTKDALLNKIQKVEDDKKNTQWWFDKPRWRQ